MLIVLGLLLGLFASSALLWLVITGITEAVLAARQRENDADSAPSALRSGIKLLFAALLVLAPFFAADAAERHNVQSHTVLVTEDWLDVNGADFFEIWAISTVAILIGAAAALGIVNRMRS